MMDRTRWEMYDSARWLLNSSGRKVSVKFVQFEEYGKWNDTDKTTALGFMRYYLSARAEALKESIGKITTENPPAQTTGSTAATTGTLVETSGTTATTDRSYFTIDEPVQLEPSPAGCGGANMESPVLLCGGAVAAIFAAVGARSSSKKKKDE